MHWPTIRSTRSARAGLFEEAVRTCAELQGWNEQTLFARVERAIRDGEPDLDGEVAAGVDPAALTGLVQSVVHGFSVQANLGTAREGLLATAQLAHKLICRQLTSPTP
ncbi:hypothetical protein [Streptomyces sp. A1-5]|uniref:hypothetical protein n=1 Tax=Streptomyces sp. A1-5 TaxID=2738410 RepID=UPI001F187A1E|nr:hypothetical protein [Streptomyces sp. A1-5]UJB39733.1 hypothetical protein HRD51_01440 [Streptomyces sp. A1-5]